MNDFDKDQWNNKLREIDERMHTLLKESVERIEKLALEVEASRLFATVALNLILIPANQQNESKVGTVPVEIELLAYHLYPHFCKSSETHISFQQTQECLGALEKLLMSYSHINFDVDEKNYSPGKKLCQEVELEGRIVRGSAYPEQTIKEIIDIQGKYDGWFDKNIGLSPSKAVNILLAIRKKSEDKIELQLPQIRKRAQNVMECWENAKRKSSKTNREHLLVNSFQDKNSAATFGFYEALDEIAFNIFPIGLNELDDMVPRISSKEWDALIGMIGMTGSIRLKMNDPAQIRERPLYVLPDGRVFLIDISNTLDALWEKFEDIAKTQQSFFQKYQRGRSDWLEQKIKTYLSRIIPKENIYTKLLYPDIEKPQNKQSVEIDCIVEWGPFLVLVEAKASQYPMKSQLGNAQGLYRDISNNIGDAFEQGKRALRYIEITDMPGFNEVQTSRKLVIQKNHIQRVYLLTVSLHHFGCITGDIKVLREVGFFKDSEYPLAISIADLEIISEFCEGPEIFLHYIERRNLLQKSDIRFSADEIDLFGAYLDTRLQEKRLWNKGGRIPFDVCLSGGWTEQFDMWMHHKRGSLKESPQIELKIPKEIKEVLIELRKGKDDASKWIAFTLLDMSDRGLDIIAKALREIKTAQLTPGCFRRLVIENEGIVFVFMASLDLPKELLQIRTEERVVIEKYKRKAEKAIGLGIMGQGLKPFECIYLTESPWQRDEEIELMIKQDANFQPVPGQKLPGRNEPCICGSGKKYKKCCYQKFKFETL